MTFFPSQIAFNNYLSAIHRQKLNLVKKRNLQDNKAILVFELL